MGEPDGEAGRAAVTTNTVTPGPPRLLNAVDPTDKAVSDWLGSTAVRPLAERGPADAVCLLIRQARAADPYSPWQATHLSADERMLVRKHRARGIQGVDRLRHQTNACRPRKESRCETAT